MEQMEDKKVSHACFMLVKLGSSVFFLGDLLSFFLLLFFLE
jgi:hypothetical protein